MQARRDHISARNFVPSLERVITEPRLCADSSSCNDGSRTPQLQARRVRGRRRSCRRRLTYRSRRPGGGRRPYSPARAQGSLPAFQGLELGPVVARSASKTWLRARRSHHVTALIADPARLGSPLFLRVRTAAWASGLRVLVPISASTRERGAAACARLAQSSSPCFLLAPSSAAAVRALEGPRVGRARPAAEPDSVHAARTVRTTAASSGSSRFASQRGRRVVEGDRPRASQPQARSRGGSGRRPSWREGPRHV